MSRLLEKGTIPKLMRSPRLIPAAIGAAFAMAPRGWWRKAPFLPVPNKEYWKFRMETFQGGDGTTLPSPQEFVEVVGWFRSMKNHRR
jgi:hypothetical protein